MQVAQLLHELTSGEIAGKKKAAIMWDDRCPWSFDDLKCLCTTVSSLVYADFLRPFKFHTNASGSGLGVVLYQTCDDGMDAVIANTSSWNFLPSKLAVVEEFH